MECGPIKGAWVPPTQKWVDIPPFPGYQASEDGQIRKATGRVLRQREHGGGGRRVKIGKSHPMVHHLIAATFFGRTPLGYRIVHLNGDRADNRIDNLAYGEAWEKCPNGHPLARDNVLVIDKDRGCLTCLLEVLDAGSPRWIEYFQSREKPELAPGPT